MSSSDVGDGGGGLGGAERRRRRTYTPEEKQQLVAESSEPGASVSRVAQRHAINANLLFTWRRQMRPASTTEPPMELIPIEVVGEPENSAAKAAKPPERRGAIEIALVGGARIQVDANVNEAALKRVLSALKATT